MKRSVKKIDVFCGEYRRISHSVLLCFKVLLLDPVLFVCA